MNKTPGAAILVGVGLVGAAIAGGFAARAISPGQQASGDGAPQRRPMIQIVRQQPGLPSLADTIAGLCPSIAAVTSEGGDGAVVPAFAVTADGWLIASTAALPTDKLEARFGEGAAVPLTEVRSDPVSGLSIVKAAATGLQPIARSDELFPRVGELGFSIADPTGSGCTAQLAMIASDFLTDGGAPAAYVRLQPMGPDLPAGAPLLSGTGQLLGVVAPGALANSVIPADVMSDIVDELVRGSLSPTVSFGFRAEDFDASMSARLSNSRSSGTAVALVQPKSPAARAGLRAGDIVVGVNGSPVASASELGRALDGAGKAVSMDVLRADDRLTLNVARAPAT